MREHCIVCGAPLIKPPLFVCRNMPGVSQDLPTKDNLDQDSPMNLDLCQCSGCGLVQFDCEPVPYYRDSTRAGERCEALIALRQKQYKHLIETYQLQGKKILEVGAGKGGFLKTLKEMKEYQIQEYGIENNPEFVKIARETEGVNVQQGYTETSKTEIAGGPFDAFVSFSYPARLIEPNTMLQCVSHNLTDEGVGLIMVPSLEHLLKPGGFYDIARDHIAYYSKDTLRFLLQKNGFDVLEQGEVSQLYIYAIVKKRALVNIQESWSDVGDLTEKVRDFAQKSTENGKKLAVWCAGHFAFTVLSTSGIASQVSYIIDNAKFKQGCFAPASHVPIVGVEHYQTEPVDSILILGPIYIEEIIKEIKGKCSSDITIAAMDKSGLRTGL
ncbi:methyltransferase domain-containing protein [Lachnospiraceae bacterium]|nr:methyltransferase domain-containing protein [Lachnospiraceae bacterium]